MKLLTNFHGLFAGQVTAGVVNQPGDGLSTGTFFSSYAYEVVTWRREGYSVTRSI